MAAQPTAQIAPGASPHFRLTLAAEDRAHPALQLEGRLVFAESARLWRELSEHAARAQSGEALDFDLSRVAHVDGGTMALLVHLRAELRLRDVRCELVGAQGAVQDIVRLYQGAQGHTRRKARATEGGLAQIGAATVGFFKSTQGVLGFLGDVLLAWVGLLKEPRTANWAEVPHTMERAGADAVPIVLLINFLVGLVMAFQGAVQLKQFGANIFVADLVGLSIARELGPLMTAIIVCGRSGAAFAAELGSMKVSEEIDALRTLGFGPISYLVLPRTLALMLVLPALTLLGDFVAMLGGLFVGITSLDLTVIGYLNETRKALSAWDVFSGVVKSVVFAIAIALIACQQGFAASGGAEGVGRRTTSAVVSILFSLILIDAGFTFFFHQFHL
jgi:phospholipid/cholesterol/gamma-HCH transport system permease protein